MINKKFIHFKTWDNFTSKKLSRDLGDTTYSFGLSDTITSGEPDIPFSSIVFIQDEGMIVTHGKLYDGSGLAHKLKTAVNINSTSFDGTEDIVTDLWGKSRTFTISDSSQTNTGQSSQVDGSADIKLVLPQSIDASVTKDRNGNIIDETYTTLEDFEDRSQAIMDFLVEIIEHFGEELERRLEETNGAAFKSEIIEWKDLKAKKDASELDPGRWYKIENFTTFTNPNLSEISSGQHVFDLLVLATSPSTLSDDARAMKHNGDNYFAQQRVEAWEIKYCLENDTARFSWASPSGKGVIWYMKDEYANECYYDFKNILFNRYLGRIAGRSEQYYATQGGPNSLLYSFSTNSVKKCYTFGRLYGTNVEDFSLSGRVKGNKINYSISLPNTVILLTNLADECRDNYFGNISSTTFVGTTKGVQNNGTIENSYFTESSGNIQVSGLVSNLITCEFREVTISGTIEETLFSNSVSNFSQVATIRKCKFPCSHTELICLGTFNNFTFGRSLDSSYTKTIWTGNLLGSQTAEKLEDYEKLKNTEQFSISYPGSSFYYVNLISSFKDLDVRIDNTQALIDQEKERAQSVEKAIQSLVKDTSSNFENYYTKYETYSQSEIQELLGTINQFTYVVVDTLPAASSNTLYKIYLVPAPKSEDKNVKREYITIKNGNIYSWELLGDTTIDLSDYINWSDLEKELRTVNEAIENEKTARELADQEERNRATQVEEMLEEIIGAFGGEVSNRLDELDEQIADEKYRAERAEEALGKRIEAEEKARADEDKVLKGLIDKETERAKEAEGVLNRNIVTTQGNLEREADERIEADSKLQKQLEQEIEDRETEDGKLLELLGSAIEDMDEKLEEEITRAKGAEENLNTEIGKVKGEVEDLSSKTEEKFEEIEEGLSNLGEYLLGEMQRKDTEHDEKLSSLEENLTKETEARELLGGRVDTLEGEFDELGESLGIAFSYFQGQIEDETEARVNADKDLSDSIENLEKSLGKLATQDEVTLTGGSSGKLETTSVSSVSSSTNSVPASFSVSDKTLTITSGKASSISTSPVTVATGTVSSSGTGSTVVTESPNKGVPAK